MARIPVIGTHRLLIIVLLTLMVFASAAPSALAAPVLQQTDTEQNQEENQGVPETSDVSPIDTQNQLEDEDIQTAAQDESPTAETPEPEEDEDQTTQPTSTAGAATTATAVNVGTGTPATTPQPAATVGATTLPAATTSPQASPQATSSPVATSRPAATTGPGTGQPTPQRLPQTAEGDSTFPIGGVLALALVLIMAGSIFFTLSRSPRRR